MRKNLWGAEGTLWGADGLWSTQHGEIHINLRLEHLPQNSGIFLVIYFMCILS